jgi:hypothetical protein
MQTVGAALISHATYVQIYAGSAALSLFIAGWLANSPQPRAISPIRQ